MNCELAYKSGVGGKEKMSDLEVVALSLTAKFISIDGENSFFKQIFSHEIPNLIKRSQFNRRSNQKDYKKQAYIFGKSRKRIKNLFS